MKHHTTTAAALTLLAALLAGCQAEPNPVTLEKEADNDEAIRLERQADEPRSHIDRAPAEARPVAHSASPEPAAEADSGDLSIRDDGRPSWWFSQPRSEGVDLSLCAEALGADMRTARAAAITAAARRVRSTLDLPAESPDPPMTINQAWVWPLPNATSGANRYAGYVLVTAHIDN